MEGGVSAVIVLDISIAVRYDMCVYLLFADPSPYTRFSLMAIMFFSCLVFDTLLLL